MKDGDHIAEWNQGSPVVIVREIQNGKARVIERLRLETPAK